MLIIRVRSDGESVNKKNVPDVSRIGGWRINPTTHYSKKQNIISIPSATLVVGSGKERLSKQVSKH